MNQYAALIGLALAAGCHGPHGGKHHRDHDGGHGHGYDRDSKHADGGEMDDQADLVHAVAFWWSADAPEDLSERMVALYLERVAHEVPGVVDVWIGPPDPSERSVVDSSFDLMSCVRFASAEAEEGWQVHPVHDSLKSEFGAFIERVQINDFTVR